MSEVVVAAAMWILVACVAASQVSDGDRTVLLSAVTIATSLTFNVNELYLGLDNRLGGKNWLELISDLLLIVGIFFLRRGLLHAARPPRQKTISQWDIALLVAVCVALVVLFFRITAPFTSTSFMLDFGDQPAAGICSIIQFLYIGTSTATMARAAVHHLSELPDVISRTFFVVLSVGCFLAVLLSANVIAMDIAHLVGDISLMLTLSLAYTPLYVSAIAFLCAGMSVPPLTRQVRTWANRRRTRYYRRELSSVWQERVNPNSIIRVDEYRPRRPGWLGADDDLDLHRMIVEIRDTKRKNTAWISPRDQMLLRAAEQHLSHPNRGVAPQDQKEGAHEN